MAGVRLRDDFDGGAVRIGGVRLQIVRDPVLRFNASGPVGLINRKAPGAVPILDDRHRLALAQRVEQGPTPDLPWCGALAGRRSLPVDIDGIPTRCYPANPEPGTAPHGLPQALGPSASPRAGGRCDRGF